MWPKTYDVQRLTRATSLAFELHMGQLRKSTDVPYFAHLLGVASLVAEDEGTEDEIIAGLLHDAAEDQGGEATLSRIESDLGETVADIVRQCSDSILGVGEKKAPWRERKEAAIAHLDVMSQGALRVTAADKLHNTRSTLADQALIGAAVWDRFNAGREDILWYHDEVVAKLKKLLPESRSVHLLASELARLRNEG